VALLHSLNVTKEEIKADIIRHFCPGADNRPDTCTCPDNSVHPFPVEPVQK
jgi:hypothetical protein